VKINPRDRGRRQLHEDSPCFPSGDQHERSIPTGSGEDQWTRERELGEPVGMADKLGSSERSEGPGAQIGEEARKPNSEWSLLRE